MKMIRISDNLHNQLKEHAETDKRTIASELEIILQLYFEDAAGLTSEQYAIKNRNEKVTAREHIVQEGKDLGILTPTPQVLEEVTITQVENNLGASPETPEFDNLDYKLCKHGNFKGQCFDKKKTRACEV